MKHLQELLSLTEERKFKVGDKVMVPASAHDTFGEDGVILKINKQTALVKFDKYEDEVDIRHLRRPVKEDLNESKDLDELVDAWMEHNNAWRTEGPRGRENIEKLTRALGYRNMDAFLEDNPGVIERMFEWIKEQNITEWKEALAEFDEDDHDEDDK